MHNTNRKLDNVVDIPSRYGMDGPGFETGRDKRFPFLYTHLYWPWGAPRLLFNGYWVSSPRVKGLGHYVHHARPSVVVKNEYSYACSHPLCPVAFNVSHPDVFICKYIIQRDSDSQQFLLHKILFWATCFDSFESSSGPLKDISKVNNVHSAF